jgi:hypothetical protein
MMLQAPVTNWEPHGVTFARYCYAMKHGMEVQTVTPYRVSHLQRCDVTVRGNVTHVYPPLRFPFQHALCSQQSYPYNTKSRRTTQTIGFGGLVVSMLAEAVGFFGRKNPQHAC